MLLRDERELLPSLLKKEQLSDSLLDIKRGETVKNCQKHSKNTFYSSESLTSFFLKEIKSDSSLMVVFLQRANLRIRSLSLFSKERRKQFAHSRYLLLAILSERAKEWIPNPGKKWTNLNINSKNYKWKMKKRQENLII